MDSMTLIAVAERESLYFRGHMTELRAQTAMFRATLAGRIWKTMTQIILGRSQLGKEIWGETRFVETYFEPAQASSVVFGLVFDDTVALEVHEEQISVGFIGRDVEYEEIEHCDKSKAFVQLGERLQNP